VSGLEAKPAGISITGWDLVWVAVIILGTWLDDRLVKKVVARLLHTLAGLSEQATQLITRAAAPSSSSGLGWHLPSPFPTTWPDRLHP
jgi:hypothetical protein